MGLWVLVTIIWGYMGLRVLGSGFKVVLGFPYYSSELKLNALTATQESSK